MCRPGRFCSALHGASWSNSLSDLFHEKLAIETIDALHAVITVAHWHRFLVLTKRAGRMRAYYADPQTPSRIALAIDSLATTVLPSLGSRPRSRSDGSVSATPVARTRSAGVRQLWAAGLSRVVRHLADPKIGKSSVVGLEPWPLPNLWPGVSVEDQERIDRIGDLLQTPAVHSWACFEPLLGPIRPDVVPIGEGYLDALLGDRYRLDGRGRRAPIPGQRGGRSIGSSPAAKPAPALGQPTLNGCVDCVIAA